jgi:hypothetical protein
MARIGALLMVAVIAVSAAAQTPHDRKMIAYAKAIPVSQLDPKLPATPFETWLIKEAGENAQITWEVNDCGEQSGSPEDGERDFPVCVEAVAHRRDKRVIVVSIAVGTYQKAISGKPVTWWITVGPDPTKDEPLKTLSDVPAELADTGDTPPARNIPPSAEVKK